MGGPQNWLNRTDKGKFPLPARDKTPVIQHSLFTDWAVPIHCELQQDSQHFIYSFIFSIGVSFLQVKFAMKLDLAGTMVWSIDTDDFHGDCINNSGGGSSNYPLMRTISRTITEALQEKQEHEDRGQTEHTVDQEPSAACKIETVLWVMAVLIVVWHSVLV